MALDPDPFNCWDCGVNTSDIGEYYMVLDAVWQSAVPSRGSYYGADGGVMLCIGCLESRLGRRLVSADFIDAPINYIFNQSDRMVDRILGGDT